MTVPENVKFALRSKEVRSAPRFAAADIKLETVFVPMRDGVRLATDLYLPPQVPAPVVAVRTPYARDGENLVSSAMAYARRGYAVAAQDLRGTGGSEPEGHDFYIFEPEDGYDFVEWISAQSWCDGFIGSDGISYVGQVQWPMATHPKMTTIVPGVSGLGVGVKTANLHMVINALARTIGKGEDKVELPFWALEPLILDETLSTGFFNEPVVSPVLDQAGRVVPRDQRLAARRCAGLVLGALLLVDVHGTRRVRPPGRRCAPRQHARCRNEPSRDLRPSHIARPAHAAVGRSRKAVRRFACHPAAAHRLVRLVRQRRVGHLGAPASARARTAAVESPHRRDSVCAQPARLQGGHG